MREAFERELALFAFLDELGSLAPCSMDQGCPEVGRSF